MTSPASAPGTAERPQLTAGVKILYGIGSIAYTAKNTLLGLLLLFYNQLVGLPAQWVSLALSISLVIDAVWDPLVGYVSDGLRSRLGRRHPLMYFSAIPFAVCWALLFYPPEGWSDAAQFAWLLFFIVACRMLISLFEVPATALTPELAPDYHARTDLFSYRLVFGVVGAVGTTALGYGIFLRDTPEHPMGQLNQAGYGPYAIATAVIAAIAILVATAGTHRWIPTLHNPVARQFGLRPVLRELADTLFNRHFAAIVVAGVFTGIATGVSTGLEIYFNTYFWEMPASNLLVLVMAGIIGAPLAAVLAPLLSRKIGKKYAAQAVMTVSLVVSVTPITLRLLGLMPDNGSPLLLGILFGASMLTILCNGAVAILVASMLSDVVETCEVKTGRRSEGLLMSASTLLQKMIGGFATVVPGLILAFVAFPDKARPGLVEPEVLRNLALTYLPATASMAALAIVCLTFYRIDRRGHEERLRALGLARPVGTGEGL